MPNRSEPKGFTLIELAVVIFVLSVGLASLVNIINQNIQVQYINRNALIGSHLAQEGLELARNIRDTNFIDPSKQWYDQFAVYNGWSTSTIFFDHIQGKILTWPVAGIDDLGAKLFLNSNGFYVNDFGSSTIFRRIIVTHNATSSSSTVVSCLVEWTDHNQKNNYQADTVLYNWR
jgi:prepilin-type N-terminal cleavage/methylation domain-containing protein